LEFTPEKESSVQSMADENLATDGLDDEDPTCSTKRARRSLNLETKH